MNEQINSKQETGIKELINKEENEYSLRELKIIKRFYPELKDADCNEIKKNFFIQDKTLSVYDLSLLHSFIPEKSAREISEFLNNDEELKKYIDSFANASNKEKNKFWKLFSVLPLTDEVNDYVFKKFNVADTLDEEKTTNNADTEEEVNAVTSVKVNLPIASKPQFEKFLENTAHRKNLSMPEASYYIFDPQLSEPVEIKLTGEETSVAYAYAEKRLAHIKENRNDLIKSYKKDFGLPDSAEIDSRELKEYYFNKLIKKRLFELAQERKEEETKNMNIVNCNIELRFSQYRKGMTTKLKSVLFSEENLDNYFARKTGKVTKEKENKIRKAPTMIKLSDLKDIMSPNSFGFFDMTEQKSLDKIKNYPVEETGKKETELNELQKAYMEITHATKSGEWGRAIEIYVKYMDYLPQYLEHRIGVLDIYSKYKNGEISSLPKNVLSVASGPHEELRAQFDVSKKIKGYEIPEVVSLDLFDEMLKHSRNNMPEEIKESGKDVKADMRNISVENEFDMIECSSFDNLKDEQEAKEVIIDMIKTVKPGGILRFMLNEPFSDDFCKVLSNNNITILEKNKRPQISESLKSKYIDEYGKDKGQEIIKRIKYKLDRHIYFVAIVNEKTEEEKMATEMKETKLYNYKKSTGANAVKKELIDMAENKIEERNFDYNVMRTVAMQPLFFLQKKNLSEKYLEYSLKNLKGKLDSSDASRLYQTYLNEPELSAYAHIALEIITEIPEANKRLPLELLEHENEAVREIFKKNLIQNFGEYVGVFLESNISPEMKSGILKEVEYSDRVNKKISNFLYSLNESNKEEIKLIFDSIPQGNKIELPIYLRFSPEFKDYYFVFSKGEVNNDSYSNEEAVKIIDERSNDIVANLEIMDQAIDMATSNANVNFSRKIFNFLLTNQDDKAVIKYINEKQTEIDNFLKQQEDSMPPKFLMEVQAFREQHWGIKTDKESKEKLLAAEYKERYKKIYDKYFSQRKRIDKEKDNFIREIEIMRAEFAKEYALDEIDALYFFRNYHINFGKTQKGEIMDGIIRHYNAGKVDEIFDNVENKDIKTKITVLRNEILSSVSISSKDRLYRFIEDNTRIFYSEEFSKEVDKYPEILDKSFGFVNNDKIFKVFGESLQRAKLYKYIFINLQQIENPGIIKKVFFLLPSRMKKEQNDCLKRLGILTNLDNEKEFLSELIEKRVDLAAQNQNMIKDEDLQKRLKAYLFIAGQEILSDEEIEKLLTSKSFGEKEEEFITKAMQTGNKRAFENFKNYSIEKQKEIVEKIFIQNKLPIEILEYIKENNDFLKDRGFIKKIVRSDNLKTTWPLLKNIDETTVKGIVIDYVSNYRRQSKEFMWQLFEQNNFLYKEFDIIKEIELQSPGFVIEIFDKISVRDRAVAFEFSLENILRKENKNLTEEIKKIIEKEPELLNTSGIVDAILELSGGVEFLKDKLEHLDESGRFYYCVDFLNSSTIDYDKKVKYLKSNQEIFKDEDYLDFFQEIRDLKILKEYLFPKLPKKYRQGAILHLINQNNITFEDIYYFYEKYPDLIDGKTKLDSRFFSRLIRKAVDEYRDEIVDRFITKGVEANNKIWINSIVLVLISRHWKVNQAKDIVKENWDLLNDETIENIVEKDYSVVLDHSSKLNIEQAKKLAIKMIEHNEEKKIEEVLSSRPEMMNDEDFSEKVVEHSPDLFFKYSKSKDAGQIEKANKKIEREVKRIKDMLGDRTELGIFKTRFNPRNDELQSLNEYYEKGVKYKDIIGYGNIVEDGASYIYLIEKIVVDEKNFKLRFVYPIEKISKKVYEKLKEKSGGTAQKERQESDFRKEETGNKKIDFDEETRLGRELVKKIEKRFKQLPNSRKTFYMPKVREIISKKVGKPEDLKEKNEQLRFLYILINEKK